MSSLKDHRGFKSNMTCGKHANEKINCIGTMAWMKGSLVLNGHWVWHRNVKWNREQDGLNVCTCKWKKPSWALHGQRVIITTCKTYRNKLKIIYVYCNNSNKRLKDKDVTSIKHHDIWNWQDRLWRYMYKVLHESTFEQ